MNYLIIRHLKASPLTIGNLKIDIVLDDVKVLRNRLYTGYSKREAIRLARKEAGCKGKHLTLVEFF